MHWNHFKGLVYTLSIKLHTLVGTYVYNTKLKETFPKINDTGISNCLVLPVLQATRHPDTKVEIFVFVGHTAALL